MNSRWSTRASSGCDCGTGDTILSTTVIIPENKDIQKWGASLTYFKRYHRKPATELKISTPETNNLMGRDAHERAQEILNETIDASLWKAVGVQQGEGISQAVNF